MPSCINRLPAIYIFAECNQQYNIEHRNCNLILHLVCNTNETEFEYRSGINTITLLVDSATSRSISEKLVSSANEGARGQAMYKAFGFLLFVVLFSCSSGQTTGQVTGNDSRPANETNTEANRLLLEGIELTGAGQLPQAVRALEEAIKLDPDYADAYAALGRAYFKMREWRRAVDNLHRSAALNAKQREAKIASQQQSAATSPHTSAAKTQQEQKVATPKVSALVKPEPPGQKQDANSETRSVFNSPPAKVTVTPAPATRTPQIKATESMRQPEKQAGAATVLSPTTSGQTVKPESRDVKTQPVELQVSKPAEFDPVGQTGERSSAPQSATLELSTQPQRMSDPSTSGTPTSTSPAMKLNAVETTLRTSPEVTQGEKTTGEGSTLKSDAANAADENQEPTGISVSMSSSPISSTVENRGVSPIPLKPSSENVSLTKVYRVGPGDVLDVRINEAEPRQSTLFTVTSTGLLEHPILAEPLYVSALTTEEIETKIQDDLKKRALIEDPEVTVGVRDYASHTILVSGLVKESGTKLLRREAIPLYVVVADAQPLPEAAKVTVLRNELNQLFEIDLTNVADMSLLVRPGDVINLHPNQTQFIYIGGEVKAPGEIIFRRGLTLTQAIISAGGMMPKSKVAEIGRDDGRGFLVKTSFKLKDIQTGKAMDPLVRSGDRIMILR